MEHGMRGKVRTRTGTLLVAFTLVAAGMLAGAGVALATTVTINGTMEGNLPVTLGNTLRGGFAFTVPGNHPAETVGVSGTVTVHLSCSNDGTQNVSIPVSFGTGISANDNAWHPSNDNTNPNTYEDGGGKPATCTGNAHLGATFTADIEATASNKVCVKFHYKDMQDGDKGGWSSTLCVVPDACTAAYNCTGTTVRTTGALEVGVQGTNVLLAGTATKSSIRSQVSLARVTVRNTPRHGIAFKVFATRHFPSLHLATRGRLYGYKPATAKWHSVGSVAGSGIYAAVLH